MNELINKKKLMNERKNEKKEKKLTVSSQTLSMRSKAVLFRKQKALDMLWSGIHTSQVWHY
jgi:hypothetical protein